MNNTTNTNFILHRPSRSIKRVATSVASSRADVRNYATAGPLPTYHPQVPCEEPKKDPFEISYSHSWVGLTSHCLVGQTFESKAPVRVPKEKPLSRSGQPESITCPRATERPGTVLRCVKSMNNSNTTLSSFLPDKISDTYKPATKYFK